MRAVFDERGLDSDEYTVFTTIRNPWRAWSRCGSSARSTSARCGRSIAGGLGPSGDSCSSGARRGRTPGMSIDRFADESVRVLRLENLSAELPPLLAELGLPDAPIPHINRTLHGDYRAYYDRETRKSFAGCWPRTSTSGTISSTRNHEAHASERPHIDCHPPRHPGRRGRRRSAPSRLQHRVRRLHAGR